MTELRKPKKATGFQFKQFYVAHDQCAQKVGTDSILLGSWCSPPAPCRRVLDVGAGSGLLALMLAQRTNKHCRIDAVELDDKAAAQGKQNFSASPWAQRLGMYQGDFVEFSLQHALREQYDLIVSNPPYFAPRPDLLSSDPNRRRAREQHALTLRQVFEGAHRLLSAHGELVLVLPSNLNAVPIASEWRLFLHRRAVVFSRDGQGPKLQLLSFNRGTEGVPAETEKITIYLGSNRYSDQYRRLCQPFYLNF